MDGILHFYSNFNRTFCNQLVETLIRHHGLRHLIWVCTVAYVPQKERYTRFKLSSKIVLLTVPRRYYFCGSFLFFLSCVCYRYAFVRVWLFVLYGHLLEKGLPLGTRLWCLAVSFFLLYHWCPGSGVVFNCIDSRALHPYLLL